jgi:glycosyltransferase involved in cell wall biosynthesis
VRVLFDISCIGIGQLYPDSRGGSARAQRHLAEALSREEECELLLCANCSSVAFAGAADFLAESRSLRELPLVGPSASRLRSFSRQLHGSLRARVPDRVFPGWLRTGARMFDQRAHPPVNDADPPVDIFHSGAAPLPPRSSRRIPRLLSIYDVRHLTEPSLREPQHALSAAQTLGSLHPEDWVITTSQASRAELVRFGVAPPERIFVTPLAADRDIFRPEEGTDEARVRLGLPREGYLVALNTADPRKNTQAVIRAFTRLSRDPAGRGLTLVLAGVTTRDCEAVTTALEEARLAGARILRLGYLTDGELASLYRGALAFVYPSLHEGFGLPPLEAMQCGTPVVTSDRAALPEVVGEGGIMVAPDDVDALAHVLAELCRDDERRLELRERGLAQASRFSWERCARDTVAAYRAAAAA